MGEEPKSVPDVVKFELFQESAEGIKKNHELNKNRTEKLEETNKFRAPIPKKTFDRGITAKYGPLKTVQSTEAGLVKDTEGKEYQIKQVQVVEADSTEAKPPQMQRQVRDRLKPALREYADALKTYLRLKGPTSLSVAAKHLNQEEGFKEAKKNLLFIDFVKLFPQFKLTGKGPSTKVSI
jgi:hypothetical protein